MTANNGGGVISQINELKNQIQELSDEIINIQRYAIPVGTIIAVANNVPTGFLLCNGQSVSRVTYADLFEYLGTKYGSDSDDTFKVPNYTNIFLQGADNNVGTIIAAGLPNIEGSASGNQTNGMFWDVGTPYVSGAFKTGGKLSGRGLAGGSGSTGAVPLNFDASTYNSIYGNSTTVQPPAVTVNFCIKY